MDTIIGHGDDVSQSEQLFACKLGGRKPTRSGKSPTHSRHFAQSIIFRYSMAGRGSLLD